MSLVIDNETGQVLGVAIGKLPMRQERQQRYNATMDELLNRRVSMVHNTSPQARAQAGARAKQAIPDGLTTFEARNWLDGLGQVGG